MSFLNLNRININSTAVLQRSGRIGIIIIGTILVRRILFRIINEAIKRIEDDDVAVSAKEQRAYTLADIAKSATTVTLYVIAVLMVLSELGANITPILTGAGVLGLAVGFGTQTLVKDVVTGFFVLLEGQFNKGDFVELGGIKGTVQEMRIRTTVIKGENGEIYIIPNSQITKVAKLPRKPSVKKSS